MNKMYVDYLKMEMKDEEFHVLPSPDIDSYEVDDSFVRYELNYNIKILYNYILDLLTLYVLLTFKSVSLISQGELKSRCSSVSR